MKPVCILPSHGSVNKIEEMGSAHINLVLREEGKKAAEELKEQHPICLEGPMGKKEQKIGLREFQKL